MIIIVLVLCWSCLFAGIWIGTALRKPRKSLSPAESPVEALLEQVRWLPVMGVTSRQYENNKIVPVMDMDCGISLVGVDSSANRARLYHCGVLVGLTIDQEQRLGTILTERQADRALDDAVRRLLEA